MKLKNNILIISLLIITMAENRSQADVAGSDTKADYQQAIRAADASLRQGRFEDALPAAKRAYTLGHQLFNPRSRDIYPAVNLLFQSLQMNGLQAEAGKYADELLTIAASAFGKDHAQYGITLQALAHREEKIGNVADAKTHYAESVEILSRQQMPQRAVAVDSLISLVRLNRVCGNYEAAHNRLEELMTLSKPILPPFHAKTAQVLLCAAEYYSASGNYNRAESLYVSVFDIYEKLHGTDNHPDYAYTGMLLGTLYRRMGEYDLAFKNLRKSLMKYDSLYGRDGLNTVGAKHAFAALMVDLGDNENAIALQRAALDILQRHERSDVRAAHINNLAWAYLRSGDVARAEALFLEAYQMHASTLGPESEACANILATMAAIKVTQAKLEEACQYAARSEQSYEGLIRQFLVSGSELQKMEFLKKLEGKTHFLVELGVKNASRNSPISRLGMRTVLRRKGRAQDLMFAALQPLRHAKDAQTIALLAQLDSLRETMASKMMQKADDHKEKERQLLLIQREIQDAEALLCRRSKALAPLTIDVTVRSVADALPSGSVLVEYVYYKPTDLTIPTVDKDRIPGRYAAYCLTPDNIVTVADLGEAAPIDEAIRLLRQAVMRVGRDDVQAPAKALYQMLVVPVKKMIPQASHVFMVPDSQIHLIPFEMLVGPDETYLIETMSVSYLSSGRDLLHKASTVQAKHDPVIIGNPDYDYSGKNLFATPGSSRSIDLESMQFAPLPGTEKEVQAIGALIPSASLLLADKATESGLKQVDSPALLHIATHGFFLASADRAMGKGRGLTKIKPKPQKPTPPTTEVHKDGWTSMMESSVENAMMRSGLAFAGANRGANTDGEGIMTALEAAQLKLDGTKMVVLSACETGLGDVRNGEGVMGLKRAFQLAGSQTQVMSLWKVHDDATKELMTQFYRNLKNRQTKPEAMRNAQLDMLKTRYGHPYYWAAFTVSGDYGTF